MADPRFGRLEGILLALLPVDGRKVPNGQLRPNWVQAAAAAEDNRLNRPPLDDLPFCKRTEFEA